MGKENHKKDGGTTFMRGASWYHRTKILQEDGSTKYSKIGGFQTKEEAEESYRKHDEEYKKLLRAQYARSEQKAEIGFADYLKYWFEDIYSERIENTTRMLSSYVLYDLILPNVDQDIKLRYLNKDYLDELLSVVSKACDSAGNKSRELLYIALKEAVIQGFATRNAMIGTKPYGRKKPHVMVLNKDNTKKLVQAASKTDWYLEVLLGLFMGLRKGEILGLKFSDICYEGDDASGFYYLNIQRQITANPIVIKGSSTIESCKVVEKAPKSDASYRKLRIPEEIYRELEIRRGKVDGMKDKMKEEYYNGDYVSAQPNGLPHSVSSMNIALTKMCSRNGLPHISVHSLRRMAATIMLEQGVALPKISAFLGHTSINTTFQYYTDIMDEKERIVEYMNHKFTDEDIRALGGGVNED